MYNKGHQVYILRKCFFFSGLTFSKQAAENSGNNWIDSTFRLSPDDFIAHFRGFAAKTKALAREILPTTEASLHYTWN